jgi:hypothetical protein
MTMDKRSSQNGLVTSEACCFVRSVVQLTSSGLLACRIFGPSGNAGSVDIGAFIVRDGKLAEKVREDYGKRTAKE